MIRGIGKRAIGGITRFGHSYVRAGSSRFLSSLPAKTVDESKLAVANGELEFLSNKALESAIKDSDEVKGKYSVE